MPFTPFYQPFKIQFDKPTYAAVKQIAKSIEGNNTDAVTVAVRVAWSLVRNQPEFLTEAGQAEVKRIVAGFKNPAGLE